MLKTAIILVLTSIICSLDVNAEVKLANIFGDRMVLQRNMKTPVWGWGDPGESVEVEFMGATNKTLVDASGRWLVSLGPFPAGGPYELKINGGATKIIRDIMIGEVWICSGQSNMQWPVSEMEAANRELEDAAYPEIRLLTVRGYKLEPQKDLHFEEVSGKWVKCNPGTARTFSAPGFFFGRDLHRALKVPIGIIVTAEGSSPIRSWISPAVQQSNPLFKEALEEYKKFPEKHKAHQEAAAKAKAAGAQPPSHVYFYEAYTSGPGVLYNARIHPLAPFGIRGVIWWQGENEAIFKHGRMYKDFLPVLIQDWRTLWGQGDFPFLIVQLQPFGPPLGMPVESEWAAVRDGQRQALHLANTAMVITTDICEPALHPRKKKKVSARLLQAARAIAYGEKLVYSGPLFDTATFRDGQAVLTFTQTGGGLAVKGDVLDGFTIAGADKKYVPAKAEIKNDTVVVFNKSIPDPKGVRYAWADNPSGNLYNKEGLPASCFKTESW